MNRRLWIVLAALAALLWPLAALAQGAPGGETTPPDQMSNFALWSAIGGAALTYVAAFINRVHWPDYVRFGTFFAFSLVYAAGVAYFTRTLDFHDWARSVLIVVASGIAFYQLNKGSIKAFEAATS